MRYPVKFILFTLLASYVVYGAEGSNIAGTWKSNDAKSDVSNVPTPHPREATLTITDENHWTYTEISASGEKTAITEKGSETITIKAEPTGNPYLADVHFILKANGKEVRRTVMAILPGGKALVTYTSGITEEGKPFSDVIYWEKSLGVATSQ